MKKFYGLTGTRLNIAIAIIAGIDFALFGYDQVSLVSAFSWTLLTALGCLGRPLDASVFSEILSGNQCAEPSGWHHVLASIELPRHHCRRVYFGMFLWGCSDDMAW